MSLYHFNRESIVPGGLEDIDAAGFHRRPRFKTVITRSGHVALFTKTARTRTHAPGLVVTIKKNLNFNVHNGLVEGLCPFSL